MKGRQKFIAVIGCCLLLWAGFWMITAPIQTQGKSEHSASGPMVAATKTNPKATPTTGKDEMLAFIKKLQKDKKLGKEAEEGSYHTLEDFERSEAKLNYFFWYTTEYAPKNFILRADVEWESASTTANWDASGFGIVFHESENQYLYYAMVYLDGNVEIMRVDLTKENYLNERWVFLAKKYYGRLETPKGQAHIDLVVNQDRVYVYLNNKLAASAYDNAMKSHARFGEGNLAFTLSSGTNAGFGTWVKMSNIELWEMKDLK